MPIVPFDSLPDASRVWVFGSDRALTGEDAQRLLAEVDRFLGQWKAHGVPLTCARDWRDEHLLTIGVDSTAEGVGLFDRRVVPRARGGRAPARNAARRRTGVLSRRRTGAVHHPRPAAGAGERQRRHQDTPVFDTGITSAGEWRSHFEAPARSTCRRIVDV